MMSECEQQDEEDCFKQLRNFVIVGIIVRNAPRAGVIYNMENNEYQAARFENGSYHIMVKTHKTDAKYDPGISAFKILKYLVINCTPEFV